MLVMAGLVGSSPGPWAKCSGTNCDGQSLAIQAQIMCNLPLGRVGSNWATLSLGSLMVHLATVGRNMVVLRPLMEFSSGSGRSGGGQRNLSSSMWKYIWPCSRREHGAVSGSSHSQATGQCTVQHQATAVCRGACPQSTYKCM